MMKQIYKWALMLLCSMPFLAQAKFIRVNDLGDPTAIAPGRLTLRQAVTNAVAGDTLYLDISGTFTITSPLIIGEPIHIMGAYPKHTTIDLNGDNSIIFNFSSPLTASLSAVKITNSSNSTAGAVIIASGSRAIIKDCFFVNITRTSGNGAGLVVAGGLSLENVMFNNVRSTSAVSLGGAILISNVLDPVELTNCTFTNCEANTGGAVFTSASTTVVHCTFYNNNATSGNGHDIYTDTDQVTLKNSVFGKSSGNTLGFIAPGTFLSMTGNVYTFTPSFSYGSDYVGPFATLSLTSFTDGYGLQYLKPSLTSSVIDRGTTGGIPATDCRRAPRILYGSVGVYPDAGAVEVTRHQVTSGSASATPGTFLYVINNLPSYPAPNYYIEVLAGATLSVSSAFTLNLNNIFIDGFANASSAVPGPGTFAATISPASLPFTFNASGSLAVFNITGSNVKIHGLNFSGDANHISSTATGFECMGNQFGTNTSGFALSLNANNATIGGGYHYQRNVFLSTVNSPIEIAIGANDKIQGNLFGTNNTATSIAGSTAATAIKVNTVNVSNLLIGGDHHRGRGNIFAGMAGYAIDLNLVNTPMIVGNYFGIGYNGISSLPNQSGAIKIFGGSDATIGLNTKEMANYIGNCDPAGTLNHSAIYIDAASFVGHGIYGNYIGVDTAGNPRPNNRGIEIANSQGVDIGGSHPTKGNVIVNSLKQGIILTQGGSHYVNENLIGVKRNNTVAPNGMGGIFVGSSSVNNTIINNVISGSGISDGITLDNVGSNNVSGNFIGTDTAGLVAMPNKHGIYVNNGSGSILLSNNIIAGNNQNGISLNNSTGLTIRGNIIGLNKNMTAPVSNSKNGIYTSGSSNITIGAISSANIISGNAESGIRLDNSNYFNIMANYIGVNPSLVMMQNLDHGIYVSSGSNNIKIGDMSVPADSNIIRNNGKNGVYVFAGANTVEVARNNIQDNGELGISLDNAPNVPLPNDAGDADAAAVFGNAGQNYPVISGASVCYTETSIRCDVDVDAVGGSAEYRIDFYAIPVGSSPDATNHGEGNIYLGSYTEFPASTPFNIIYVHPVALPVGTVVTATCSKLVSPGVYATSEFSANAIVAATFTADASITQPITCVGANDGEGTVVHGGLAPFTYNWRRVPPGASVGSVLNIYGLNGGNYDVVVTDATGCSVVSDTITFVEPAAITLSVSSTAETCDGAADGSVTVTGSGGTGGLTYQWQNSAAVPIGTMTTVSPLPPDTYTVTATDGNACTASNSVTVLPGLSVVALFTADASTICQGGTVNFTDGSTNAANYNWDFGDFSTSTAPSPSHTYSTAGTYTVQLTVVNGTCTDTETLNITVSAPPTVNAGGNLTVCETATGIAITGTSSAPSISWSSPGSGTFTPVSTLTTNYTFSAADYASGLATAVLTAVDGPCTSRDTITITLENQPSVNLGTDRTECETNTITFVPSTLADYNTLLWTTSSPTGTFTAPNASTTDYDATGDGGTTVTIILTATSATGACPDVSDNLALTVNDGPTANAGTNTAVCYSVGTFTPSGSVTNASTQNWNIITGGGTLVAGSTLTPTYTFAAADQGSIVKLELVAQNPPCLPARDTISITVDIVPVVVAGSDTTICTGSTITFNGTVTNAVTQTWSGGTGTFGSASATSTTYVPIITSGIENITLTSGANGACTGVSDMLILTVTTAPTVNAGTDDSACYSAGSIAIAGTVTGASTTNWVVASGTGTVTTPGATTTAYNFGTGDNGTTVKLVLEAIDPACGTIRDTVSIDIDAQPSVNAGLDATVCAGVPFNLVGTINNASTQSWTSSGGGSFTSQFSTSTAYTSGLTSGNDTITLVSGTNGACNAAADEMILTVNAAPVADAGTDVSICNGSSTLLDGSGSTGAPLLYSWSPATGLSSPASATTNASPTATIDYILTVTNAGACTDADTVNVTVNPLPDPAFTYSFLSSFCTNDPIQTVTVHTTGGTFSVIGGGLSVDPATGDLDPSTGPGVFDIVYTLTSPCPNADTISITINAKPVVTLTSTPNDHSICYGDTLTFTGTPTGGTFTPTTGLNTTTGKLVALLAGVGAHSVEYAYTDANGCTSNDTFNLVVNPPPAVSFSGLPGTTICASDGPFVLTGTPAGGGFAINLVPAGFSPYSYSPTAAGTDSIVYAYQDPVTGCINYDFETVTVIAGGATPVLSTPAPYIFCESSPQNLVVTNPGATVTWYNDAGLTQVITTGTNCSSSLLNDNTSTVYVVNATGTCSSTPLAVPYTNYTFNAVNMGGPYETCAGTPLELQMSIAGGVDYAWMPSATLSDTAAINPIVTPTTTTTYTLQLWITALPACVKNDSVVVTVKPCSLENVTNAFTPDGDGINDVWIIDGIESHPDNRVTLFNRWGDKLIQFEGYDNTSVVWDGKYKSTNVASGTYYYVIEYMDDGQQAAGWIQVNY